MSQNINVGWGLSPIFMFSFALACGCIAIDKQVGLTEEQSGEMYRALQVAWPKYVANSLACYGAKSLAQDDEACRNSFDCLRRCGYEVEWVYRLTDVFLLETRDSENGKVQYFKLGRFPNDGGAVCRMFDLKEKMWIDVNSYACSLRFAPLVVGTTDGCTEMWDSVSDTIIRVPEGFHAIIQGGAGMFLLRKDADGEYYSWNAVSRAVPRKWKYYFPAGWNTRSSFFLALSSETGKSYAFAIGLEPIPNSEGALAIGPCGAYKGRQYYKIWKGDEIGRHYYAWPEKDRGEPLSNGTETFGGFTVLPLDGRLVVLSPEGRVEVDSWGQTPAEKALMRQKGD